MSNPHDAAPDKKTSDKPLFGGKAGPGRPKGVPNKTTVIAKDAIAKAAEALGGADRLVAWAKEDPSNEKVFWGTIYPKLLPLQVAGDPDNPIQTVTRIALVAMSDHGTD
ncbi:hypothetical protein [Achromobacter aegrifaciens]|uniref:hypothetical protein n=1 Tax=Achromobacter aegrifaciens TaxID=1287736 RepID=UPI003208B02B